MRWKREQRPALGKCDHPNGCPKVAGGKMPLGQMGLAHLYHWLGNSLLGLEKTVSIKSR